MTSSADDPVETIMAECLNRSEAEWSQALAEACARYPELAGRLRARFDTLQGWGLVQPGANDSQVRGQRIGDYEVLADLGAGTSATVLRARHVKTGDLVALKLLRNHMDLAGRWRERFERELRLAQSLQHEGLCKVLAWGDHDGQPFLVMDLVEGHTLAAEIAAGRESPSEVTRRVRVLTQVAHALQCMHACGLIHRDVKPGNILVREDGSAVLTDLGLAFDQEEGHSLTASNVLPGSPAYLAPELVQGSCRGSVSTDVFSLGVILHECTTGNLPFDGATRAALFGQILSGRRLPMAGPRALRRVAATAMAQHPRDRYRSAKELANDLERCLRGQRPLAQGPGLLRSMSGWVARNYAATMIILALALGGAVAAVAFERTQKALAETRVYALTLAAREALHSDVDLSLQLAEAAHRQQPLPGSRSVLYEALARRHQWRAIAKTDFPEFAVPVAGAFAAVSPTGIRVDAKETDHAVRISLADGTLVDVLPHPCEVRCLALSSTGDVLATGGGDGVLRLFRIDPQDSQELASLPGHRGLIRAVVFGANDTEVFTLSDDGTARAWQTQSTLPSWRHPLGTALSGAVPAAEGLLVIGQGSLPRIVDVASRPIAAAWLRDVRSLFDSSHHVLLQDSPEDPAMIDLVTGIRWPWHRKGHLVRIAAATNDRKQVYTVDEQQIIRWVQRANAFAFDREFATAKEKITALAVSKDGRRLACGSAIGVVTIFSANGRRVAQRQLHREHVWSVAFHQDGQHLLTASRDETAWYGGLTLLDGTIMQHSGTVLCAKPSPTTEPLLATGCVDGVVRLWDADGKLVALLRGHRGQVAQVTFVNNGETLISSSDDGTVRSWPIDESALLELAAKTVLGSPPVPAQFDHLFRRN